MSSILICSTPVHGHVTPLLAVTRTLVAAGHEVRFLTGQRYRDAVEAAGARFLPLPDAADYDDRSMDTAFPRRVGLTGPAGIRYDMIEIFLRPMRAQAAALRGALTAPTDLIMTESMFTGILSLLVTPRAERPPIVNLGIIPLGIKSRDTAPFGLGLKPMPGPVGRLRDSFNTFVAEKIIFAPVQKFADEQMLAITGKHMPGFFLNWPSLADAIVQFTVPEFEYPRSDLPDMVHFVGPVSTSAPNAGALPEWWGELDGSRPVVHVSQGTVANQDYEELILPTMRGLAGDDVIVVVSTGGRPISSVPERVPANVRLAEYLPYDELLPRVDVMVTNGGYGGVHFALTHGVPLVVAGATEDKIEVSARVEWSGVGVNLRTNRPSDTAVAAGVRRVLADNSFRDAANRIGASIARAPGVEGILAIVDRLSAENVRS
ncbi:glycosyltransferase [Leifsonia sp. H3M29-4]|uniref:glycosyltransferase n=1 Tax=Salinibacterium metalliresistens TaxID=3031321 RepID=UPI0023DC6193|nr:nucleotide disphospho-sugar-binding domain-containing protein [Salinibacterium metalliresistens]MDF1478460.1 glycosyltransferase [Salinibacterium metalliresistens]